MNRIQKHLVERLDAIGPWREYYYSSLSLKQRVLIACTYPIRWAREEKRRFDLWATTPGDVWEDFQRRTYYVVKTVRATDVVVWVLTDENYWAAENGQALVMEPEQETFARTYIERWCHVRNSGVISDVVASWVAR